MALILSLLQQIMNRAVWKKNSTTSALQNFLKRTSEMSMVAWETERVYFFFSRPENDLRYLWRKNNDFCEKLTVVFCLNHRCDWFKVLINF